MKRNSVKICLLAGYSAHADTGDGDGHGPSTMLSAKSVVAIPMAQDHIPIAIGHLRPTASDNGPVRRGLPTQPQTKPYNPTIQPLPTRDKPIGGELLLIPRQLFNTGLCSDFASGRNLDQRPSAATIKFFHWNRTIHRKMATFVVIKLIDAQKLVLQVASSQKGNEVEVLSPDSPEEKPSQTDEE